MISTVIMAAVLSQAGFKDADAHFAIAAISGGTTYLSFVPITDDRAARFFASLSVPIAGGLGREVTQALAAKRWTSDNTSDLAWSITGAMFGAIFSYAVDKYLSTSDEDARACRYVRHHGDVYKVCVEDAPQDAEPDIATDEPVAPPSHAL
jgi:hypothetical protein